MSVGRSDCISGMDVMMSVVYTACVAAESPPVVHGGGIRLAAHDREALMSDY